jgi:hypothetical protein
MNKLEIIKLRLLAKIHPPKGEYQSVQLGICPICGCTDKWLMGPQAGGLSFNTKCDNCQSEFCVPTIYGFTVTKIQR